MTVFIRQNLTYVDVRFSRVKTVPALKKKNIYNGRRPITYIVGIQMKREELTNTFQNKNPLVFMVYMKICQRVNQPEKTLL